jgi:hypothetical protein
MNGFERRLHRCCCALRASARLLEDVPLLLPHTAYKSYQLLMDEKWDKLRLDSVATHRVRRSILADRRRRRLDQKFRKRLTSPAERDHRQVGDAGRFGPPRAPQVYLGSGVPLTAAAHVRPAPVARCRATTPPARPIPRR